jgi:Ser/Thr protein kinase RdoA (MazF antagonist)
MRDNAPWHKTVNGDWHLWNQLYSNDGTVKCIMDFDFIQEAERVHDVAMLYGLYYQINRHNEQSLRPQAFDGRWEMPKSETHGILDVIVLKEAVK